MSNPNDRQVAGTHYQSEFQHWDFVSTCLEARYLEGCASKYVTRCYKKNGAQDLEKAIHYLEKLISEVDHGYPPIHDGDEGDFHSRMTLGAVFCSSNQLDILQSSIILGLLKWQSTSDLQSIRDAIITLKTGMVAQ